MFDLEEVAVDLKKNKFIQSPISRIDEDVFKQIKRSRAGRKRKYSPVKFKNDTNKYFEMCEKKDEIPSKKGLMIFLKMSMGSFDVYKTYPEFKELIDYVELVIDHWCENDVYKTSGTAAGKIAYMKNVHGWREKTEIEQTVTHRSVDEARAKIEALLPDLLEFIKRQALGGKIAIEQVPVVIEGEVSSVN